jgi:tetratricopeptide (TPR) repeat protein
MAHGWTLDRDSELAEIRRMARRVSTIGNDDALALCFAGHALVRACREYDTGAAMIDQSLSINPNLAVCWQFRGWVSVHLGQHDKAIEQITHALRLNPLDPDAYRSEGAMALAHMLQGRYDDAVEWGTKALTHQQNAYTMRVSAVANALAGNTNVARTIMAQMRQLDPALRISHIKDFFVHRRPEDIEKWIEGLRLAGLPE